MNALDELRNKQIDGDENDLERCILRADTEGYCNEADNAAAELAALQQRVTELEAERAQEVDEFNAGFDAYKTNFDLDNAEQEYQNLMLAQNIPFHDVFGTGYAWAKFTTERAAVFAKGDAQ